MHLEDLFIDPEYRGNGYGKALLKELAKIVLREVTVVLNGPVFHGTNQVLIFMNQSELNKKTGMYSTLPVMNFEIL